MTVTHTDNFQHTKTIKSDIYPIKGNPDSRLIIYNHAESPTMDLNSSCMQRYPYGRTPENKMHTMEKNADQIGENKRTQLCGQSIILTRNSPDDKHFNSNQLSSMEEEPQQHYLNSSRIPFKLKQNYIIRSSAFYSTSLRIHTVAL